MAGPFSSFAQRAPSSLPISQIQFDKSPRFHRITNALYVRGYFHSFILPTLHEDRHLPMEPLDWEFGVRCNRPFEGMRRRGPVPKPPPRPKNFFQTDRKPAAHIPTKKAAEETPPPWTLPPPASDPYNNQTLNEGPVDGPLKVWVYDFLKFLRILAELVFLLLLLGWNVVAIFALPLARFARSAWKAVRERMSWQNVICLLIAYFATKLLPGFEGAKVVEKAVDVGSGLWRGSPPPLYIIRIPVSALAAGSE